MKLKDYLKLHAKQMLELFNLTRFDVRFKRTNTKCASEIDISIEYLDARIEYGQNLERYYRKGNYEYVLKTLCHEIVHLLLENLAETPGSKSKKHRIALEQATEHTSRLLYRLYVVERKNVKHT